MRAIQPIYNLNILEDPVRGPQILDLLSLHVSEFLTLEDIEDKLYHGDWTLWVDLDDDTGELKSIAVTSFENYPRFTALRIILTSGDGTDWPEATAYLERFAIVNGCETIEILGRKGWERALAPRGFTFQNITLRKRLT